MQFIGFLVPVPCDVRWRDFRTRVNVPFKCPRKNLQEGSSESGWRLQVTEQRFTNSSGKVRVKQSDGSKCDVAAKTSVKAAGKQVRLKHAHIQYAVPAMFILSWVWWDSIEISEEIRTEFVASFRCWVQGQEQLGCHVLPPSDSRLTQHPTVLCSALHSARRTFHI